MATNNVLVKDLIDFGLSEKEAQVYIALLELEVAPVNEVAKKAGVNRSSAYVVLESLKEKGLVAVSDDKQVQQFVASSPEVLLRSADHAVKNAEIKKNKIEKNLPELKGLHKETKQRPKVRVFEGTQGIIAGFEESIKCEEKFIRAFSTIDDYFIKTVPEYFPLQYLERRFKNGVKMKGIHYMDKQTITRMQKHGQLVDSMDEHILIEAKKRDLSANFAIFDDKLWYLSPVENGVSIVMESREITNVMKKVFDLAWEEAKRVSKKKK